MESTQEQAQQYPEMNFDESLLGSDLRFGGQGTAVEIDVKRYCDVSLLNRPRELIMSQIAGSGPIPFDKYRERNEQDVPCQREI